MFFFDGLLHSSTQSRQLQTIERSVRPVYQGFSFLENLDVGLCDFLDFACNGGIRLDLPVAGDDLIGFDRIGVF